MSRTRELVPFQFQNLCALFVIAVECSITDAIISLESIELKTSYKNNKSILIMLHFSLQFSVCLFNILFC